MTADHLAGIRAGIIGPSGIGRVHADALRRLGVEVRAVAASSAARSAEIARMVRAPVACTDAAELVNRDDIDVVHICTPNFLHFEQCSLAIEAGKHVICEKPLTTSADSARTLLERAQARGIVHAVVYNYRAYPMLRELRRRVSAGELGKVHLVHGAYLLDEVLMIDDPEHWMLDPERIGPALVLADVGIHWWDLVEYVAGEHVTHVMCSHQTVRADEAQGEDSAALLLRLAGGAVAAAAISDAAPGRGNTIILEFIGTAASAWWSHDDPDRLRVAPLGRSIETKQRGPDDVSVDTLQTAKGEPYGYLEGFRDLLAAVYASVAGEQNGADFPSFADGLRGVRILEAVLESGHSNEWVEVSD